MRIVRVTWRDAYTGTSWMTLAEADEQSASRTESVGYLVREDNLEFVIARDASNSIVNGVISIPIGAVECWEVLCETN